MSAELSREVRERIDRLVCEVEDLAPRMAAVAQLETAAELQYYALAYNWDDGFDVPTVMARHPKCDRGVALTLFWLADGLTWYLGERRPSEYQGPWAEFCEVLTEGLLAGKFPVGETSFDPGIGRVQLYQLRKQDVPEILFTPVEGALPSPPYP